MVESKTKIFKDIWIKKKLEIKTKIIGANIIFKLPRGKGDVALHHPRYHLIKAD